MIDFGQNHAGYVEIRYRGVRGERIRLSFAEVLDRDGNFYNANYRASRNDVVYVLDGVTEIYKPSFTFQGYRYVRIDEFPVDPTADMFTSVSLYSDMERLGDFHCGREEINRLYDNILYGQRSNFIDIPTDCPQRDERLGWTGDACVFSRTAAINYDTKGFFTKWMEDVALEQYPDGGVGSTVPRVLNGERVSSVWGDVATVLPMELYLAYGDRALLARHYPVMRRWVDYMHGAGPEEFLWIGGHHYGDWLGMDAGYGSYVGATQTDLIASAYFAHSTMLCIRAGRILGEDVRELETLYGNVRRAFREAFMKDGLPVLYHGGEWEDPKRQPVLLPVTQTALSLILHMGLFEEEELPILGETLVRLIRENGGRMTTGFVGTPILLHALTRAGYTKEAYDLLLTRENPSWLFSVYHGATTIWEHWDSVNEQGEFWSTDMNSFNHYAYGSVFDWIYGVAVGITVPDEGAGYTVAHVRPHPDRRLGHMAVREKTPMGALSVQWQYFDKHIRYELTVPQGMTVLLTLPSGAERALTGGRYLFVEDAAD